MRMNLKGFVGERMENNISQWLLTAPYANPAMLEMFRMRERSPRVKIVPWYGEFPGKYMTSAVLAWRMTRNEKLYSLINWMVDELAEVQSEEGYLGPHPFKERLTGADESGGKLWDIWGHYHIMLGLLMWHEASGNKKAWEVCIKSADYISREFLKKNRSILEASCSEMNTAVIHIFCLLYKKTGNQAYLDMARHIEKAWEHPEGGDYIRAALEGKAFYETRKPRWESLHGLQGISELYRITGDDKYSKAFQQLWWSIVQYDRHNTGAFSSGEKACGNPYDKGAIETCCTIAWMALTVDMLCLTGDSYIADELELAAFNGMLGAQHPSGRWWTYNTPMDGIRRASAHDIVFQALQGSPELNCCSVNGPRGIGMFADWTVMSSGDELALNYYGPGTLETVLPSGQPITIEEKTDYPVTGEVELKIGLERPETFGLKLRIPVWSINSQALVNGEHIRGLTAGTYLNLKREWKDGDTIKLSLDMSLHFWAGEKEYAGKVSIYRGPILLTFDQRYNLMDCDNIPVMDIDGLAFEAEYWDRWLKPWILLKFKGKDGRDIHLCDFASAGATGTSYASWLNVEGLKPVEFDRKKPVWNL